jgi:hypothetical protein
MHAASITATAEYHIQGRTGKQCRERWHNHLGENVPDAAWLSVSHAPD